MIRIKQNQEKRYIMVGNNYINIIWQTHKLYYYLI